MVCFARDADSTSKYGFFIRSDGGGSDSDTTEVHAHIDNKEGVVHRRSSQNGMFCARAKHPFNLSEDFREIVGELFWT